ncbi:YoaK family protein [Povalibacter sp.]|uniref:YoaK family protein n=1 Tax=Povalibacter sp. TaxID=1962978 RepID=UPI002F41CFD0
MSDADKAGATETTAHILLPVMLSVVAGMVDLTGFLTLGNLFTAHVTGNIAILAAVLARDEGPRLIQLLIIPMFLVAIVAARCVANIARSRRVSPLRVLLAIQFLLLSIALTLSIAALPSAPAHSPATDVIAAVVTSAMAFQFILVRTMLPGRPSTVTMTTNLADTVLLLLEARTEVTRQRLRRTVPVVLGFFAGCVIAGVAVRWLHDAAWAFPAGVAALALLIDDQGPDRE